MFLRSAERVDLICRRPVDGMGLGGWTCFQRSYSSTVDYYSGQRQTGGIPDAAPNFRKTYLAVNYTYYYFANVQFAICDVSSHLPPLFGQPCQCFVFLFAKR